MPRASIVMPTYNRADHLADVVDAALRSDAVDEVVVVVDGCDDGSLAVLEQHARHDDRLVPLFIENRGGAGARQAGLEVATSDIVIFVDDDVALHDGAVEGHLAQHDLHPGAVVVGYMPIADSGTGGPSAFATDLYNEEYERLCARYELDTESVLANLWGGNISLPRDAALAVGWWHPGMGRLRHHDRDFGLRCKQHGLVGVFDRSIAATHLHHRSLPDFRKDSRSQGAARTALAELHPGAVGAVQLDEFSAGLPGPLGGVVRASRHPLVYRALGALLVVVLHLTRSPRLRPVQVRAGRLLRRMDQLHGAASRKERR